MSFAHRKPPIIVICGPTGIGKTAFAISLAGMFNSEIVGADSMQVYRQMNIGTAKPTAEERTRVMHHLIDVVDPDENFDAEHYAQLAGRTIAQLHGRNIVPFVVGGTGLYIKSLINGLFDARPADTGVRRRLKSLAETDGNHSLYQRLQRVDPAAAEKIHVNDTYRLIRALEIHEITGKPISDFHRSHGFKEARFRALKIGLHMDRQLMYERINRRVEIMIDDGFIDEVRQLLAKGYAAELKSMQSLGYRQIAAHLAGRVDLAEATRLMKRDTRRYAKRQMTWFRGDEEVNWMAPDDIGTAASLIKDFLDSAGSSE
ncbi:MAG: tRNA (adenosine(37)-N6)-dimethylallyltransferase MiaA [Desulfobacteraceae bacterium]|nr:tRNA (adenosine(37)-N6)-dimethylallyltransferase MiaA [Desulfobacteraceae bacterium]